MSFKNGSRTLRDPQFACVAIKVSELINEMDEVLDQMDDKSPSQDVIELWRNVFSNLTLHFIRFGCEFIDRQTEDTDSSKELMNDSEVSWTKIMQVASVLEFDLEEA